MSIILFFIILLVLVLVHEWGHFIVAKKAGIRVDEFAFGFPPRLFSIQKGETRYAFNLLPIGGYVKIFGEDPSDTDVGDTTRSFSHQRLRVQAAVLVAGVVMNLVLAATLLIGLNMFGSPASALDPDHAPYVAGARLTVTGTNAGTPADAAGLRAGDVILEVKDGDDVLRSPAVPEALQEFVGPREGKILTVVYEREKTIQAVSVIPVMGIVSGRAAIGISMDVLGTLRLPPHLAVIDGVRQTYDLTVLTGKGLAHFFGGLFVGQGDLGQVTGPVGIVNAVGAAAENGIAMVVFFTALISINLAIINILPFPALDGGRLFFLVIEGATGRRVPNRIQNWANFIGFALLMLLMIAVTVNDVVRL